LRSEGHEQSQECDDVAQRSHSKHKHQDKKNEQEYPDQQGNNSEQKKCIHQKSRHEKHEWENRISTNHDGKLLVNREKSMRRYQINPSESQIIINKEYIISMTSFGHKTNMNLYIRMNQIKGCRDIDSPVTGRIVELQLFAKLATYTMVSTITKNMS
jgi:hypothetical protein